MDLFAALRRRRPASRGRRPVHAAPVDDRAEEGLVPADDDATTAAPGSFLDSSWVLRAGVAVIEHERLDPVAQDLPLAWWIDGPGAAALRPSSPRCR